MRTSRNFPRSCLLWPAHVGAVILTFMTMSGCSCRRTPEFDSGLDGRRTMRRADDDHGLGGLPAKGPGGERGGGGSGSGDGSSAGAGSQADGAGASGDGADGAGEATAGLGGAAAGLPAGNAGGQVTDGGGRTVAGNESGIAAGIADAQNQQPAALPGRPAAKPKFTAEQAIPVAEAALDEAAAAQRNGHLVAAYESALRGYEAVSPHVGASDACRDLAGRATRLLKDLAEHQNRKIKPQPVETIFE
jgi:hypothetical protein